MKFTPEDIKLLIQNKIIPPNTPDTQVQFFLKVCERKKLDPFLKQIHLVERNEQTPDKRWTKSYTIQASIDGMRAIAQRQLGKKNIIIKKYERGVVSRKTFDTLQKREITKLYGMCRIQALVNGELTEYSDELPFDEYVQRKRNGEHNHFWKVFPETMIKKCAEESVLRMLAPEDLSDVYGDDEMGGDGVIQHHEVELVDEKTVPSGRRIDNGHKPTEEIVTVDSMEVLQDANASEEEKKPEPETKPLATNPDKYLPEDEFKQQFKSAKNSEQVLAIWKKLSGNQKANKKEQFVEKLLSLVKTVDQLVKLMGWCDDELKHKFSKKFSDKRLQLEGKTQEDMFQQADAEKLMQEIDRFKSKKELQVWVKKNLKKIQALEPASYKRITDRLATLEESLVDY